MPLHRFHESVHGLVDKHVGHSQNRQILITLNKSLPLRCTEMMAFAVRDSQSAISQPGNRCYFENVEPVIYYCYNITPLSRTITFSTII